MKPSFLLGLLLLISSHALAQSPVEGSTDQEFFSDESPNPSEDPDFQFSESSENPPPEEPLEEYPAPEFAAPADEEDLEGEMGDALSQPTPPPTPTKPKPAPLDEPPPIIRRERELVEIPSTPPKKWIRHPNAEKGLTKITRDKVYVYRVPRSEQKGAASLRFGLYDPPNLTNPSGENFGDYYSSGNSPAVIFDYEWHWFKRFGRLGPKLGGGLVIATGSGRFQDTNRTGGLDPKESLTFLTLPFTAGAIYRMQYWDKQILVPYAEGGGVAFSFAELRDDNQSPKFGVAWGAYGAAGVAFNMSFLDTISMLELDREYGINNIYLVAEYRYLLSFGSFDFTSGVINGGFLAEF